MAAASLSSSNVAAISAGPLAGPPGCEATGVGGWGKGSLVLDRSGVLSGPPKCPLALTGPRHLRSGGWGGRRQGRSLQIRRARPWPAVGVGTKPPRKVPTFPEGNPGVCALCRRPTQQRSKIRLFLTCSKNLKNVTKWPPRGSPNGARNLKNLKKMPSGCLLKSKLGKKTEIVRILTPSNPLKRAKTCTKTPFSRFHPDTQKSPT